jgi:tetratricopeptide (TPR) repeat protein
LIFSLVRLSGDDTLQGMKFDLFLKSLLGVVLLFGGLCPLVAQEVEEPNEKAARYHTLLLKKPGNTMVFSRFVDAWLDTGGKKGLTAWLEGAAKKGTAADWRVLGALHQYLGEDEEALKALNEAVTLDGENAELRLSRAKMQARLLAFEAALVDLDVAAKDEKTAIESSKLKGVYLARSGQVDEAVKAWKEVIAAYPKDEDLREDLIEVEVMEGLYKDAIEASTALVGMTKDPYKKTLRRLRLGDIQILAGDRDAGLKTYEEIMAATGEGTWLEREVLAQVERVFLKEDDIKGLRDYYQKLREEYPRRVSIRKVLARQMALNDEIKEAIALFQEVLKITPGDLGNREEFIAFLEANEKWKEAKEELGSLLEQRKEEALLWERLSRIEAKLNDQEGLKTALAKVAELRKVNPEGLLAAAALYEQAKLVGGAEALLREGRVAFPDSLEVSEGLASFLVQNKKEDEALEIWKTMAKGADREGLLRVARSLNSHGKGEVAFGILGERIGDFEDDSLILTQYCKLASSVEESSKALPQGLALVNQATTPTELESAVQTAMRLVARAEKKEEMQKSLAGQADLGVGGQCLLSAIYADVGDTLKASEILTKAGESPEGSLARFYRVRFEEDQGNFEKAIEIMRGIIETPEGRKTVHLRRLVDLLERTGDYDKALVAVEDWKRIAPGDHAAWNRRARLLQANARPEDAVVELRRMIGKFGADEERRANLAAALIEAAEYTPAQRIYEQLYSESEKLESKLKWAGEMAQLAEKEGKLEELLEDFDRRKRTNPRSVAPLLAIAEIHRVLDQYEERRSALLEASRRRPEDTELLARIAEVEERAGEFDRAVGILRDAVKRDKTPDSKRRLAALLLKNGEVQSGLDLLSEIPGTVNDPRGLEGIVQALVSAQETEQALQFLDKHLAKHEADWRLRFLKAMVLKMEGENEQSLEIFITLLKGGHEIPNLKPLVAQNAASQDMGPWRALFGANGWEELTPYQQFISRQNFGRQGQGVAARISLPGTPRELQLLSLLQGSTLLTEIPEKDLPEAQKALSLPGIKDVDILTSMMSGGGRDSSAMLQKRADEDPENVGLFALSLVYKGNSGGITEEEFAKAEEVLLKDHPGTFAVIAFSALQSPEVTAERLAGALGNAIKSLPQDEGDELMQLMSFYTFSPYASQNNGGKDMSPIKNLMAERALATLEAPKNWQWMPSVVSQLLAKKKVDDAITLINRHCEWQAQSKNPTQATGIMAMMSFGRPSRGNAYLAPPSFPPSSLKGVPGAFLQVFLVKATKEQGDNEQVRLLAQLQMQDGAKEEGNPAEEMGGRLAEIKNPALRALAFLSLDQKEAAKKLIEGMLESREESSLLFAAGYFFDQDDPRSYDALLKLRMLPLSRQSRKKVDGHLAVVGSFFSEKKEVEIDLEPAKRAALRLRRVLSVDEREALGEILGELGLEKEAKRLAAAPKPAVTGGRLGGMIPSRNQGNRIIELKKEGNIDGAAREAAKQFRSLVGGRGNDYELRQLGELLSSKELKEETLKKLDPGESESTKRLLEFAMAQQLIGTKEKAREVYEKVLKKNPNLAEAQIGAIKNTPFAEIEQERLIVKKGGKIDVEASGVIFDSLWEAAESDEELDHYVGLCKLTATFLETLPPSGKVTQNLSWVPYQILQLASDDYIESDRLETLIDDGNGWSANRSDADKDATKKRNEAVKEVFLAMIKHPQIAEQGFMLLEGARKGLGLTDEDLVKHARNALVQTLEKEKGGRFNRNGLWAKYSGNGSSSSGELSNPTGPMTWLMAYAEKSKTEMLTPELAEKMQKAQPEQFALLNQARDLAKAEPAEAQKIYDAWKKDLPVRKREKAMDFARQILHFSPKNGPWADELEKLLLEPGTTQGRYGFGGGDRGWADLAGDWGAWRFQTGGVARYEAFLLELFEGSFGPSDKWEVLAELGEDALPQKYEQAGYAFQRVSKSLMENAALVKPTLLFIAKHPLEKFVHSLSDTIGEAWAPDYSSAERALKRIVENQLLTPEAGAESATPRQFLMVAEGVTGFNLNDGRDAKKKLGEAILKEKGLDPLLQKVAAASLLGYPKGRDVIEPVIEENLELLKAVVKASPERSYQLFRRWFPKMENAKVSAPVRELFESFAVEARAKKVALMQTWAKDGIPEIVKRDSDDFWEEFSSLVPLDEVLSHKVIIRILNDVRVARNSGRSSSNGIYLLKNDSWLGDLLRLLQNGKSQLNLSQQVRLIDSVYRSEAGDFALEPMGLRGYSYEWAWETFVDEEKLAGDDNGGPPLSERLEGLDSGQQATLAVLLADGLVTASPEDFKRIKKHEKLLKEKAPALAEVLGMAEGYRTWEKASDNEAYKKSRQLYLTLLSRDELPVVLKVDLVSRINRKAKALNGYEESFKSIVAIMKEYGASKRNFAGSSLGQTVEGLSGLNFPGMEKVAGLVAEQADGLLLSKEAKAMRSNGEIPKVATAIIKLALKSGRAKLAGKLLRNDYSAYRGNLEVVVNLAKVGDFEKVEKLVAAKTGAYNAKGLGLYDKKFHELVGRILAEIPEESRYHLEVVLSDLLDPQEGQGTAHGTARGPRIKQLAEAFDERGQALAGDARLQVLAVFASHEASAPILREHLRKVFDQMSIAESFIFESNRRDLVKSDGFEIIERVIRIEMAAKNFEPVIKKIEEFQQVVSGDGNNVWQLRNQIEPVFGLVGQALIELAAKSSEDAEAAIPQAKALFDLATKIRSETSPINTLDGASLIVHALAGKGQDWRAYLENHPEKKRYEKVKGSRGRTAQFEELDTTSWRLPEMADVRAKVLRALLDTPYYHERDLKYVHDYYGLSESGLFDLGEMITGVESLPKDHPEKAEAMFHIASLKTYKIKGRTVEGGVAAYTEALELARERGDENLANQILAHRCDVFFRNQKKEEAKRDAPLIKLDQLSARDKKWVEKALPKWLK